MSNKTKARQDREQCMIYVIILVFIGSFFINPVSGFSSEYVAPIRGEITVDIKAITSKLKNSDPKIRRETADQIGDLGNKEVAKHLFPLLRDENEYVRQAAARALGKLKDKEAVSPLIESLKDPDINVKAFSIWALGEIKDPKAIESLAPFFLDSEEKIRNRSFEALRKFEDPVARKLIVTTLIRGAKSHNLDTEMQAEGMLWKLISLEGRDVILKAIEDPQGDNAKTVRNYIELMEANIHNVSDIAKKALTDYKDRALIFSELSTFIRENKSPYSSIRLLGELNDPRGLPILMDMIKNKNSSVKSVAIDVIGILGDKEAVAVLLEVLVDPKEYTGTRDAAARALGRLGDRKAVDSLINILKNKTEDKDVRMGSAVALGDIKDKKAVEPLIEVLKDNKEYVWLRVAAVSALGNMGDERALVPVRDALKDSSDYVRNAAQSALLKVRKN